MVELGSEPLIYTATLSGEQGLGHFPESHDGLLEGSAAGPPDLGLFPFFSTQPPPPTHTHPAARPISGTLPGSSVEAAGGLWH